MWVGDGFERRLPAFGTIVHAALLPSALHFEESYGVDAFCTHDWEPAIAGLDGQLVSSSCALLIPIATLASLAGVIGVGRA